MRNASSEKASEYSECDAETANLYRKRLMPCIVDSMRSRLESGLELLDKQPSCIEATVTGIGQDAFVMAKDERGQAWLFDRLAAPAVFAEVVHTLTGKIRGNHVHQYCDETLHVLAGEIRLYLLCRHARHVFACQLVAGQTAHVAKGVPHALYSIRQSECLILFGADPRNDRTNVAIIT
jgi:quercetin dioxygenase-like cupin family protein